MKAYNKGTLPYFWGVEKEFLAEVRTEQKSE